MLRRIPKSKSSFFRPVGAVASVICVATCLSPIAVAQHEDAVQRSRFFETQAWPIIERECLRCHGAEGKPKGGLRLDSREAMLRGGDRGPAFDETNPAQSLILEMVSWKSDEYAMPPTGQLPEAELAIIAEWILEGGTWADGVGADPGDASLEDMEIPLGGNWWAWQPLERPTIPAVSDQGWIRNPIDAFVLAKLEAAGLAPAPEADRYVLIRRVALDLTGLPPTPEDVTTFIEDDSPDAYEQMVDRYLTSPQHGVKWARHWLDAVRYADTDGYERDRIKPSAWRYRDWVVNAINQDKPIDRFFIDQLAGDEIEDRNIDSLIATGFYRLGIWDDEPTDVKLAQFDDLDSIIDVVSRNMMGMSIACARCHAHKRDPILQGDYYRLAAIFRDLRPYKMNAGNSIDGNNVTRTVPAFFGSGEDEYQIARRRFTDEMSNTVSELKSSASGVVTTDSSREADGLISHYPFEDLRSASVIDVVGGHDGQIADVGFEAEGRVGHGFRFDGGDDGIRVPHVARESFTISFWVRTSAQCRGNDNDPRWFLGDGLVDGEVSGVVNDLGISMVGSGIISAGIGNPETFVNSPPGFNDGAWHHVALTRNHEDGNAILYVDGIEVGRATGGTQPLDRIEELAVGRTLPGHGAFNGDLDELKIHDRPLSAREIAGAAHGLRLDEPFVLALAEASGEEAAAEYRRRRDDLLGMRPPGLETTLVLCARSNGTTPPDTRILIRGNVHSEGRLVNPGVPQVLGADEFGPRSTTHGESSGLRLAFAEWLTESDNPTSTRVAANRIWQHHFGRGLVRSSDDFGFLGTRPTHPQLLDWLATELPRLDWSRRALNRLIMTSSTYRQSSRVDPSAVTLDPLNNLLWKFDLRRLTAEEVRDAVLAVSGNLNPELGGEGVYPPLPRAVLETASRPDAAWGQATPEQAGRRSLYIFLKRSLRHPLLEGFDQPDTDRACSVRFATTVPTQSLMMMNSDFIDRQAAIFAARLQRERPSGRRAQIARGLELALCRPPSEAEINELLSLYAELQELDELDEAEAFEATCVLMLNLNEFLHVG
ncbi:MAG: DUF1553 domain-containing protein [Phycisphaerales bacterium]|nr:DUF1553 domain-containing protein [Phycisphaerales bacterium]